MRQTARLSRRAPYAESKTANATRRQLVSATWSATHVHDNEERHRNGKKNAHADGPWQGCEDFSLFSPLLLMAGSQSATPDAHLPVSG